MAFADGLGREDEILAHVICGSSCVFKMSY
jgi:hypothetical protein